MFVGIDPGSCGGIVTERRGEIQAFKMPEAEHVYEQRCLIYELLAKVGHDQPEVVLYIEEIPKWAGNARFAKQTVRASSLAVLYGNMSLCIGVGLGLGWRVASVTPQQWQKAVGCTNAERLEKTAWKNKLKEHAAKMFPAVKVVGWNADALLILRGGRAIEGL